MEKNNNDTIKNNNDTIKNNNDTIKNNNKKFIAKKIDCIDFDCRKKSSSDFIALYTNNIDDDTIESKNINVYKFIYNTYDVIKKDILQAKDGKEKRLLEMLEDWLTRKLDLYMERTIRGSEWDFKLWTRSQVFNGMIYNTLTRYRKEKSRDSIGDNVQEKGQSIIEKLEAQFVCKQIIDKIGLQNYKH